jgi:hypothetical protein
MLIRLLHIINHLFSIKSRKEKVNQHDWNLHYIYGDIFCAKCFKSKSELKKINQLKTCKGKK